MTDGPLRVVQHGTVRWLFLHRPERRNALNDELTAALEAQLVDSDADPATSVVVLAGDGPSFCAGGDFRHFLAVDDGDGVVAFLSRLSECLARIENSPKPWVAALHGHAIAGGLELALVCDVVLAAEGTLVGDGHVKNKLLPAAGSSVRLERAVGKGHARWMHLSGEPQQAEDLVASGWIREVVAPDALYDRAQRIAEVLASRDSTAQQNMKRLVNSLEGLPSADALALELDAFGHNWSQSDVPTALAGFLADRGTAEEGRN
jgi:enoyl-CoA hydratase/carnithine racemase